MIISLFPCKQVRADLIEFDDIGEEYVLVAKGTSNRYAIPVNYECEVYVGGRTVHPPYVEYDFGEIAKMVAKVGILATATALTDGAVLSIGAAIFTLDEAINIINDAVEFINGVDDANKGSVSIKIKTTETITSFRSYVNGTLVLEAPYEIMYHREYGVYSEDVFYPSYSTDTVVAVSMGDYEDIINSSIDLYIERYHLDPSIGGGHKYRFACSRFCYECGLGEREVSHKTNRTLCTENGYCIYCNQLVEYSTDHNIKPASCYNDAYCLNDGCSYRELGSRDAYHRAYSPAPSCDSVGYCAKCHARVEMIDHNWVPADCVNSTHCSRCGASAFDKPLGHAEKPATCTEDGTCIRCGIKLDNRLGHDLSNATCTTGPKCIRCGVVMGKPLGHEWISADCINPKRCIRCKNIGI